jgi:hypothetical protein
MRLRWSRGILVDGLWADVEEIDVGARGVTAGSRRCYAEHSDRTDCKPLGIRPHPEAETIGGRSWSRQGTVVQRRWVDHYE